MVAPESGGYFERLSSASLLGRRQKNFLFHADMFQNAATELIERGEFLGRATRAGPVEQSLKAPMVVLQELADRRIF
ncbi:MAG TPA: hypothetical protein VIX12_07845 [Candidatus Binataceae bacterium]